MAQTPRITKEDVARIAQLARLAVTEEELVAATNDLTAVLQHFADIQDIDTTGVPMAGDASGLTDVMRDDEVKTEELGLHKELIKAAPASRDGQVQVKAVF